MSAVENNKQKGFTLLEILIVIAIMGTVFALSAQPLLSFYHRIVLQGTVENVLAMLDEARKSTLSSYYSSQYGVHFETSKAVLFRGATYSALDLNNDEYMLSDNTEISTISLTGGGSDVVFDRITGETSQDGFIEIELVNSTLASSTITIHLSGLVEVE